MGTTIKTSQTINTLGVVLTLLLLLANTAFAVVLTSQQGGLMGDINTVLFLICSPMG
jgi:hypothetical protein